MLTVQMVLLTLCLAKMDVTFVLVCSFVQRGHYKKWMCMCIYTIPVVFGWYQDSFTGVERDQAYMLQAGYQKGAEQADVDILLNVVSELDTASKPLLCLQNVSTFISTCKHCKESLSSNEVLLIII